ncbi:MAG: MoaD/ThiS family protein [Ectothiorhodospiraceae bacterium]
MIEVAFYGVLESVTGTRTQSVEPAEPLPTVADVLEQLRLDIPGLDPYLPRVACAQGEHLVYRRDPVDPARPLVLLPPVSGGAPSANPEA